MNKRIKKKRSLSKADKDAIKLMMEELDRDIKRRFMIKWSLDGSTCRMYEFSEEENTLKKLFYSHSARKEYSREIRKTGKIPELTIVFSAILDFPKGGPYSMRPPIKYPQTPVAKSRQYKNQCYEILKTMHMLRTAALKYNIEFWVKPAYFDRLMKDLWMKSEKVRMNY